MNKLIKAAVIGGGIWLWSEYCFTLGKGIGMRGIKVANPDFWTQLKKEVFESIKDEFVYRKVFINLAMKIADDED